MQRPRLVEGLRLVRLVGSGGEGEVWEARDARGRQRALKLIRPNALAADVERRSAYLLRIDHPAFVQVHRAGRLSGDTLKGWGFMEMAFIDGPSLYDAAADPAVLDRLWPLAEALDLLHDGAWSDGVPLVHRDVKPSNLVEAPDGEFVLVDPSTLRGVDATQLTRIGTPVFSAPEVMTGRIGPAADIYSFAATVVALLTGARGGDLAELLDSAADLDLPDGVRLALSLSPAERPATCRAVLAAGTELANDPTVLLRPIHAEPETWQAWEPDAWQPPREPTRILEPVRLSTAAAAQPYAYPPAPPADRPQGGALEDPDARRGPVWLWTWLLVLLVMVPPVAVVLRGLGRSQLLQAALAVAGVHLVAGLLAGAPLGLTLLLPPLAWPFIVADRIRGGARRRAWVRATLTGVTAAICWQGWLAWQAFQQPRQLSGEPSDLLPLAAVTLLLVATVSAANSRGLTGLLSRVLLLPFWAVGAAVVAVGALLLAPVAGTARLAGLTLASVVEVVRSPPWLR